MGVNWSPGELQGIFDLPRLDSAVSLPQQPYYEILEDKAAALVRSLIKNHPFIDGNKRTALVSLLLFLMMNGRYLAATQEEKLSMALDIATDRVSDLKQIAEWIRERSHSVDDKVDERIKRTIQKSKQISDVYKDPIARDILIQKVFDRGSTGFLT